MLFNCKIMLVAVCAIASAVATPAFSGPAAPDVSGLDEFQRHCALCHGADGRGAGPLSDAMKKTAADITQLAKRNGGHFPFSDVLKSIRDGGTVPEHSRARMPAWGKIFSADSDPNRAKAILLDVTQYVESLQEK